jgi:hypothetical protein
VRYAAEAFNSFKAIGIDCSQLCDAPGMSDVIGHISKRFVEKGLAVSGGAISEQPGVWWGCMWWRLHAVNRSCVRPLRPPYRRRWCMLAC